MHTCTFTTRTPDSSPRRPLLSLRVGMCVCVCLSTHLHAVSLSLFRCTSFPFMISLCLYLSRSMRFAPLVPRSPSILSLSLLHCCLTRVHSRTHSYTHALARSLPLLLSRCAREERERMFETRLTNHAASFFLMERRGSEREGEAEKERKELWKEITKDSLSR